jgi:hypothetical protein
MMNRPPIMAKMIKKHPANGFEDRGSRVRNRPSTSTGVRSLARTSIVDRPRPRLSIMLAVNFGPVAELLTLSENLGNALVAANVPPGGAAHDGPEDGRTEGLLIPRFRVRFPARASICCACARLTNYMLWSVYRNASYSRHLTASFDSFAGTPSVARV